MFILTNERKYVENLIFWREKKNLNFWRENKNLISYGRNKNVLSLRSHFDGDGLDSEEIAKKLVLHLKNCKILNLFIAENSIRI